MAELIKDVAKGSPWYIYLILGIVLALGIVGFILPPMGQIDPSVIQFAAEILGATWLFHFTSNIPVFLERGAVIRASHGDKTIEVSKGEGK